MLLQVLPISIRSLANPVWVSAATALDQPFVGAISLDISATLLSLARYCAILAAAFVTATVTLDKQRAESVLSLLTGIAAGCSRTDGYNLGYLFPVTNTGKRETRPYYHHRIRFVLCGDDPHLQAR
jgi:hypothetical protein